MTSSLSFFCSFRRSIVRDAFDAIWANKHNLKTVTHFPKTVSLFKLCTSYVGTSTFSTASQILRYGNQIWYFLAQS